MKCNRRDFLKFGAGALIAGFLPARAFAALQMPGDDRRRLAFYNIHTRETIDICYYEHGAYSPDALKTINQILRDHRSGEVYPIDKNLLDHLYALKLKVRARSPFHVISGYRSPATNAMLRKQSSGVARRSYHTKGKAIDIRLPGFNTRRLRKTCIDLQCGGVGYYPDSDFVHMDTGPVRTW